MKTTRQQVEIVRSTEKAHLIAANGQQGWIQKKWLAADGTVSSTTFAKAVANATERAESAARKQESDRAAREFANAEHAVPVVRETEKAVAAEIVIEFAGDEETKLVWFPKSAIGGADGVALIPGWLLTAKIDELKNKPAGNDYYARHRFCKGESVRIVRGFQIVENVAV